MIPSGFGMMASEDELTSSMTVTIDLRSDSGLADESSESSAEIPIGL